MQRAGGGAESLCRERLQESGWRALSLEQVLCALEYKVIPQLSVPDYASLLHRCKREGDCRSTLRLHAHMLHHGLHAQPSLGNLLVSSLAHFGCTHEAGRIFDSLPHPDPSSWHALIGSYAKSSQPQHALSLYQTLRKDDFARPPARTLVALLKVCAKLKDVRTGLLLHADVTDSSWFRTNPRVGNALLSMYAKCGLIEKALQVFQDLHVRDVVSWTALISSFVEHGKGEEALECFKTMQLEGVSPNAVSFVCSLKACSIVKNVEAGREIHAEIERVGLLNQNLHVASTLVDMYAKCGLLSTAQEIFDKLLIRDTIIWNSLIAGNIEDGCNMEAMNCFKQMQLEGVSPNSVTFICVLKVCSILGDKSKGEELRMEIEQRGLLSNDLMVGSMLVDMYAKTGFLAKAQHVFDRLPSRDLIAWTTLISGSVEQGNGQKALDYYEHMQLEGFSPDLPTLMCGLKACGIVGAIDKAQEFHSEIERKGLVLGNPQIGSTLVDTYAKLGSLFKAQEVFDKLLIWDIASWNALIAGYGDHGFSEEAIRCFDQMQSEGVDPDEVTFVKMLNVCGNIGDAKKGGDILALIEERGLLERDMIGSSLVEMYAKCGWLVKAREAFDKLPVRDIVVWNALISGYAESGQGEWALNCFDEMQLEGILPDSVTYICSLQACGSIGAIGKGKELHLEVERKGLLQTDLIIGNALIDMYINCFSLVKAQQVFDDLPIHDLISWNALIAGYTEHGFGEEALKCFAQMGKRGFFPNAGTFASILKACGSILATDKGQEIHAQVVQTGLLTKSLTIGSTLVNMYAKCGLLFKAQIMFDELLIRDVISWNALIAGYVEHGQGEEALKAFDQMRSEGVGETTVSFVCSLKACGDIGAIQKGHELHAEIARKGLLERDVVVGNTLIDMYARCGFLSIAKQVLDKLVVRDIVSWSSLIAGYAQIGDSKEVFSSFDRLRGAGIKPDPVTFLIVLNTCSRKGFFNACETYFESMGRDCGILPTIEHHSCMIDLLSRTGRLDDALTVVQKMPLCPNLVVWLTLLAACRKWGDVEVAKQAFEHAVHVDDKDGAAYVLMSQIYADAGMQEEAEKVELRGIKRTET